MEKSDLSILRRDYEDVAFEDGFESPFSQFDAWLKELLASGPVNELPMVLSSVDDHGHPDARVVLLKGIEAEKFVFYTNYLSTKGQQIDQNKHVALTFYWPALSRQVRVRGVATKISKEQSERYFLSRPVLSQLAAVVSKQSQVIDGGGRESLLQALQLAAEHSKIDGIHCPDYWGGYAVSAYEMEFWQGRHHRLHDRIQYQYQQGQWQHRRLAP